MRMEKKNTMLRMKIRKEKIKDGVEVEVEEHLKEVGGSHELEDVPGLDRQLLRRAVVQVLHHLQGQG